MSKPESELLSKRLRFLWPSFDILLSMLLAFVLVGIGGCAGTVSSVAPPSTSGLQISTPPLPSATLGSSYSANLAATGGVPPYTWSMKGGTLPAGLQLSAPTGAISGTPTAAGAFMCRAQVQDSKAAASSAGFSLTVSSPTAPTISGVSPTSGSTLGSTTV